MRSNKVQGIAELEEGAAFRLPASQHDKDVDLSMLTSVLCSSEQASGFVSVCVIIAVGWVRRVCDACVAGGLLNSVLCLLRWAMSSAVSTD